MGVWIVDWVVMSRNTIAVSTTTVFVKEVIQVGLYDFEANRSSIGTWWGSFRVVYGIHEREKVWFKRFVFV